MLLVVTGVNDETAANDEGQRAAPRDFAALEQRA
jgi:hypothetical protein